MATNHKPNVLVNSTDSNDTISNYPDYSGGAYNVTITARGGDDSIFNAANEVLIDAGAGYDTIENNFVSNYDGWGNNVTILGGDGNDSIKNWRGDYVSIDGGSGRDTIFSGENNANYCTISGGTGDDRISIRSASNNVFLYKNGDGNDTIDGFKADSTLSISGSSYSTMESGNDVIVYVGNGSILLTWRQLCHLLISLNQSSSRSPKATIPTATPSKVRPLRHSAATIGFKIESPTFQ